MSTTMSMIERINKVLHDHDMYREKNAFELLETLKALIYRKSSDRHDLFYLYKVFPEDLIIKLIDFYNGASIRIPSKKEYRDLLILVISFYLKEIEGRDWAYIKNVLSVDSSFSINGNSLGKKIAEIKKEMTADLYNLFQDIKLNEFIETLNRINEKQS